MKNMFFLSACFFFSLLSFGQKGEFAKNDNGLIYSDKAMGELRHIVDSLNLKFKVCENKDFYSKKQGKATFIKLDGENVGLALEDFEAGISFDDFIKKYPNTEVKGDFVFAVYNYKDYKKRQKVRFDFITYDWRDTPYYETLAENFKEQQWYYIHYKKNKYREEGLIACYVPQKFESVPLSEKYSRKIQYSECLVDTTAQVFFENANDEMFPSYDSKSKVFTFISYMKLKKWKCDWRKKRELFNEDEKAQKLFNEALDAALKGDERASDEFEDYVAHFDSPQNALFLKRSRKVVGQCSMDNSPRYHALNIAELAGETATWEIFLRAHLNIMNDRFDRMSDGSYGQTKRQTYIKELEELDINVSDLLLGICLRVENPSQNHYYGNIGRIGRALSESKERMVFEKAMLDMVKDSELDDYNRMLMYCLFVNYNHFISDEAIRLANKEKLREAVATLPDYLKNNIEIK